ILKEYGIPYYIVGSRGFFDTEEVNNIILFLKTINDLLDEKSLVGILRSQMLGVSDESLWFIKQRYNSLNKGLFHLEEYAKDIKASDYKALELAKEVLSHLRLNKSRLSINEIITYIMEATDYAKFLAHQASGEQKIINLRKLLKMAQSKEVEYIHSIEEFLEYVTQVKAGSQAESQAILESESSNTVKLMTVHQAKGLEFPIVFLPFIHQRFNVSDVSDNLIFGHKLGVFLRTEEKGYLRELAEIEEEELMLEEYMRILYVAQTRACDYLVMSGSYDIKENSEGELIARTNKQSWLKWLFDYFRVTNIPINHYFENANIQTFLYEGSDIEKIMQKELEIGDSSETITSISGYDFNFSGEYDDYEFLSATRLIDYEFCPYFVYLKYGRGLSIALSASQQEAENIDELDAAGRGLIIHAIIEEHNNLNDAKATLLQMLENSKFPIEDREKNLMFSMLENYYENDYIAELATKSKVLKEVPFMARLAGKKFISGFIDQLWLDENHYNVIDLKTGNIRKEYTSQLNMYQLALDKILPQKLENKAIFYLRAGNLAKASDQDIDFDMDKNPLPKRSIACKLCSYQFICFPNWGEES
ncbi:MAG TPA: 3'-5' exonuclease, partial [Syntrophomonadaceae bacterium]|nr:3'-5' exonuclease [Syntrophomonadaceae bacterium]